MANSFPDMSKLISDCLRLHSRILPLLIVIITQELHIVNSAAQHVTCATQINSCKCELENGGGLIDLKTLAKNDKTPAFDQIPGGSDKYAWNPCNDFNLGTISGVAACQIHYDQQTISYFNIGTQSSAKFQTHPQRGLEIVYTATTDTQRTAYVSLECDKSDEKGTMTAKGEDPPKSANYYMTVKAKACCPQGGRSGGSSGGISAGSVLIIIVFTLLLTYIIGGMVIMKFGKGAEGKEIIPNVGFWLEIPLLVRDGCIFLFTGCKTDRIHQTM